MVLVDLPVDHLLQDRFMSVPPTVQQALASLYPHHDQHSKQIAYNAQPGMVRPMAPIPGLQFLLTIHDCPQPRGDPEAAAAPPFRAACINVVPHMWLFHDYPFRPEINVQAWVQMGAFAPAGVEWTDPARGGVPFEQLRPTPVILHHCRFSPNNARIQLRDGQAFHNFFTLITTAQEHEVYGGVGGALPHPPQHLNSALPEVRLCKHHQQLLHKSTDRSKSRLPLYEFDDEFDLDAAYADLDLTADDDDTLHPYPHDYPIGVEDCADCSRLARAPDSAPSGHAAPRAHAAPIPPARIDNIRTVLTFHVVAGNPRIQQLVRKEAASAPSLGELVDAISDVPELAPLSVQLRHVLRPFLQ